MHGGALVSADLEGVYMGLMFYLRKVLLKGCRLEKRMRARTAASSAYWMSKMKSDMGMSFTSGTVWGRHQDRALENTGRYLKLC